MGESGRTVEAIVAGHICLDLIPAWSPEESGVRYRPGTLTNVGPAEVTTGGCVANTGLVLHRLGVETRLIGKVGDDPFGRIITDSIRHIDERLTSDLVVAPTEHTSYSVILSPPGQDRMVLHFPGANDTFTSDDIGADSLSQGRLFHFGYPPAMRRMYEDAGDNLALVLKRAKAAGLTTSLDMAYPDPSAPAGRAAWRRILETTLPVVDVFLPSLEEVLLMLDPEASQGLAAVGSALLAQTPAEHISSIGNEFIGMGAGIVGIKLGERGLYLRTSSEERLLEGGAGIRQAGQMWADRELWSSVFEVAVMGTTGAGDATVAGFLLGLLRGMSPEETLIAACAVGASSVEAPDATGGVRSWEETRERIDEGWARRESIPGEGWYESAYQGIWIGPGDRL
jgi:sugar/nucleoside kinase (ribokinase family)